MSRTLNQILKNEKPEVVAKAKVTQRLIELELVQNASDADQWLRNETIPSFKKTGAELIQEGSVEALLEELERIADGGHA